MKPKPSEWKAVSWKDGNLLAKDALWYKYTSSSGGYEYIHITFRSLTAMNITLYSGENQRQYKNVFGNENETQTFRMESGFWDKSGDIFSIKVEPAGSSGGSYKIAVSNSETAPD